MSSFCVEAFSGCLCFAQGRSVLVQVAGQAPSTPWPPSTLIPYLMFPWFTGAFLPWNSPYSCMHPHLALCSGSFFRLEHSHLCGGTSQTPDPSVNFCHPSLWASRGGMLLFNFAPLEVNWYPGIRWMLTKYLVTWTELQLHCGSKFRYGK